MRKPGYPDHMPPTGRKAPTFFHHRLRLLSVLACACVAVLMLQAVRLSVLGADASLERAQSRLRTHRWLPTWRGSIVDRNGTVLARDEPRWAAAVSWDALTGRWADDRAAQDARAAAGAQAWAQYTPDERHSAIDTARAPYADTLEALWDALAKAGGVDRGALDERLHATRGRVQRLAAVVWDRQRRAWEARVGTDGARFTARPIADQVQPHVLLGDIDDATAIDLVRFADTHEDLVDLQYVRRRVTDAPPGTVLIDTEAMPRHARGHRA